MFIFGWGHQTIKDIGVVFRNLCNHCNNDEYWVMTRIMTWFTLFFIPVIPYETKYFLSCPICKYGLTLDDKQIEKLRPIAETNQLLVNAQITQEEYQARMNQLQSGSVETVEEKIAEKKVLTKNVSKLNYCSECGQQVTKESKFCGNCGGKVAFK